MTTTDLIIIGAGPGGYRAAEYAAQQDLKVVIFEAAEVGGTCLNVGCIPTKTYVHSASFAEARERMSQVVPQLRSGVEAILSHPNITLVREKGVFVDAHTVGDYTAKHIIVATGSSAKQPPIADINDPRVVTSTELLQLQKLPKKLCIIGAGVIGMEFASIFQRFGSEVQVIEFLKECLPMLDSDIAKRLRKLLEKRGIQFKMKTAVQAVADIDADIILVATGRKPNTEGLNVAAAGIEVDKRGAIEVDENFKVISHSSLHTPPSSNIYAIGDVNGRQLLAHAAEMQALRAVNHMTGKTDGIRFDIMPAAIFTDPEAACVGLSEDQLKEQGISYECKKSFWRANGKAMAMNETEGMLKLFSDAEGRILGCHAFGAHAADIIQEVSVLMCRDTTISQLRDMVHIHPTLGEVLIANL
ncbi:MAG: NAD(P)/FAD-dependent oxidoreductase [Prevotella sp.]|nr:NAD(P)/FAD-dependent oxidoreductase [Prevotella sp.]